jgi:hypothetical protein
MKDEPHQVVSAPPRKAASPKAVPEQEEPKELRGEFEDPYEAHSKRGKFEELYEEHVQLKTALSVSQADAVAATEKSIALQAQVDSLLRENAELVCKVTECQKESDELMYAATSKEKLLTTRLKQKQERIEHLQLERLEMRRSLAQRGDANVVIRCLDSLQRDYDKLAHEHAQLQQVVSLQDAKLSAQVVSTEPLVLGIEAEEEEKSRCVEPEVYSSVLADTGCREAFRIGRVRVPINTGAVPVCINLSLQNDGDIPWPQTIVAALVSGDGFGCPLATVDQALPGDIVDLGMELSLPLASEPGVANSMWVLVNAANGKPLGPLLVLEVVWT